MKPLDHIVFALRLAEPLPLAAGQRSPGTLLKKHVRNHLYRQIRRRFFAHVTEDREASRQIAKVTTNYAGGAFRRERPLVQCPERHRGKLEELLWLALTVDPHFSSETIRRAIREPARTTSSGLKHRT